MSLILVVDLLKRLDSWTENLVQTTHSLIGILVVLRNGSVYLSLVLFSDDLQFLFLSLFVLIMLFDAFWKLLNLQVSHFLW